MKATAIKFFVLATVLAALALGCVKKELPPAPQRPSFNHQTHVQGAGQECAACHATATTAARAGMPEVAVCQACHGDDPAWPSPVMRDGQPVWSSFTAISDEVRFSHQAHTSQGLKCDDCHGKMAENTATGRELAFTMDTCTSCHTRKKASTSCLTCHHRDK